MSNTVAVFGSLNIDMVTRVKRQPELGETLTGSHFQTTPGGKGLNQAIAAARAGANTDMLGSLGGDAFGDELRQALEFDNVDTSGLLLHPRTRTGVAQVTVMDGGENAIVVVRGANGLQGVPRVTQSSLIRDAKCLLLQLEIPVNSSIAAAQVAKDAGTKVILTPAPFRELPNDLVKNLDVLVLNEGEARSLTGSSGPAEDLGEALAGLVPSVVVTLGRRGCSWSSAGRTGHWAAPTVPVIDTTGAGDTFTGYLGAFLAAGADLADAAKTAVQAGSLSVQRPGAVASIPWMQEVRDSMRPR